MPSSYPEAINLPFNRQSIAEDFIPAPGGGTYKGPGYWILLQGNALVVKDVSLGYVLPEGDLPSLFKLKNEPLQIGLWRGNPLRVAMLSQDVKLDDSWIAEPFNAVTERLDDCLMTLGGIGQQVLHWQRNSARCSRCGGTTEPLEGSWGRACPSCRHEHFPHIHPCIIVLVRKDDLFLLTRKPGWIEGRYGLVAGFLDFGESLEECVSREVLEETGISIKNIRYVGSQSWPFPSQLMAGFLADYSGGDIVVGRSELEDARWFPRDSLPLLPPKRSIARWIVDSFV